MAVTILNINGRQALAAISVDSNIFALIPSWNAQIVPWVPGHSIWVLQTGLVDRHWPLQLSTAICMLLSLLRLHYCALGSQPTRSLMPIYLLPQPNLEILPIDTDNSPPKMFQQSTLRLGDSIRGGSFNKTGSLQKWDGPSNSTVIMLSLSGKKWKGNLGTFQLEKLFLKKELFTSSSLLDAVLCSNFSSFSLNITGISLPTRWNKLPQKRKHCHLYQMTRTKAVDVILKQSAPCFLHMGRIIESRGQR